MNQGSDFKYLSAWLLLVGGLAAAAEDVDDDGGTDEGGDTVDRHSSLEAGCPGNEVADEGQGRSGQGCGGHQFPVIAGAEDAAGQMWYGHANEHDGAAIGGDNGNQDTRADDDPRASPLDVDTQVCGITVTQQHGIQGFHQEEAQWQQDAHEHDK